MLTTSPPGWVLAPKCQCITAFIHGSVVGGPFLWAVLPMKIEVSARAVVADRKTKRLISPAPRWVLAQNYTFGSVHDIDHNPAIFLCSVWEQCLQTENSDGLGSINTMPFWQHFFVLACDRSVWGTYWIFVNPSSGGSLLETNLFLSKSNMTAPSQRLVFHLTQSLLN